MNTHSSRIPSMAMLVLEFEVMMYIAFLVQLFVQELHNS